MIRVLSGNVLVKCDDKKQTTDSGLILIPSSLQKESILATVVSVGTGKLNPDGTRQEFTVKAGDRVIFDKFIGQEIFVDGFRHLIIPEADIFAVED